jgi:replicative DNA helicase
MTGGLHRSDLLILAARPGVGKSAWALSLAYQIADRGMPVGFVALEMGRDQLLQRLAAIYTGIDSQKLRNGRVTPSELTQLMTTLGALTTKPIFIDDAPTQTVADLQAKARRLVAQHGIRLLVIDYLQLVEGGRGKQDENRVQEVSHITRSLKQLARELNIPILALSQLSRAVESRQSKVPMLSDLRESGSLEQDSDLVMFIYREDMYDKETDKKGIAEIHIAKHRNGPLGSVNLFYDQRTTRFRDLAPYQSPEGY